MWILPELPLTLDRGTATERRPDGAEEALHPGRDGTSADGEEPVQREADGAAGGSAVDGDDQVGNASAALCLVSQCGIFTYVKHNAKY